MPSFFDLMKYAQTGIASPDMTHYDKMRARAMAGGYPMRTIEGVPPLTFKADGSPLISWSMKGNGSQTGTPTPDNPVMPDFVGTRTGNLFDKVFTSGYHLATNGKPTEYTNDSRCATLEPIDVSGVSTVTFSFINTLRNDTKKYMYSLFDGSTFVTRVSNLESGSTIDVSLGDKLYLCVYSSLASVNAAETTTNIMLNSGSTAFPYEPFGYKIPITCAGQTTTVYLGQTQTVRRVRKLVLTGDEAFGNYTNPPRTGVYLDVVDLLSERDNGYCTHFVPVRQPNQYAVDGITFGASNTMLYLTFSTATATALNLTGLDTIKEWLRQQYANGTPVTVWYVLATPETGIINEPLCKIGDYADELHSTDAGIIIPTAKGDNVLTVDIDLQPSKVSITGHIKE